MDNKIPDPQKTPQKMPQGEQRNDQNKPPFKDEIRKDGGGSVGKQPSEDKSPTKP